MAFSGRSADRSLGYRLRAVENSGGHRAVPLHDGGERDRRAKPRAGRPVCVSLRDRRRSCRDGPVLSGLADVRVGNGFRG